jgi:4-hydroxybenzoate polyprenyltransferase
MGGCASVGYVDLNLVPLYLAGVCWTVVYDTIYALQDKADDLKVCLLLTKIGVKSTAITFGKDLKSWLTGFAGASTALFATTGYLLSLGPLYYIFSCLFPAFHYGWQIFTLDPGNRDDCWNKFKSNQWLGMSVSLGFFLGLILSIP